jgi:hypothetical protein
MAKTYIDESGYLRFKDTDKLVHRWAAEKKSGRSLKPGEVVHHRNRNKLDNSHGNLRVFKNQDAHDKAHKYDSYRFGLKASYQGFSHEYVNNSGCFVCVIIIVSVISVCYYCVSLV